MANIKIQKRYEYCQPLQKISIILAALTVILGALVLFGWAFDIKLLAQPIDGAAAMNPVTAICFILEGFSLVLLTSPDRKRIKKRIGVILAILVLAITATILAEILLKTTTRIDTWIFYDKMDTGLKGFPLNYMAPNTAVSFIISSIALLLINIRISDRWIPSQIFAVLLGLIAILSVLGYIYGVRSFYNVLEYFPMAIHTAVGFLFMTIAILFVHGDQGMMRHFYGPHVGSLFARKLLPAALIIPIALGFIKLHLERSDPLNGEWDMGLVVLANMLIFVLLIWVNARELNKKDLSRIQAEENLRKSNAFLDTLFKFIPNMLFVKDAKDLRFLRVNQTGEKWLGVKERDFIGKTDHDFFPKEQADFFVAKDRELIKNGLLLEIPEEKISAVTGDLWLQTKKVPLYDNDGNPQFILGISEDITEKRKAEKILKETLNELADYKFALDESAIVAITDKNGIIRQVNDNFCKISKFSRDEAIGQDHRMVNSGHHSKTFFKDLWETITKGEVWHGELKNKTKDGSYFWVNTTIVPFMDEEGKPYQYVTISGNITEQKLLEEEIKHLNKELEQKVKERTEELSISETRFRNLFENAPDCIFVLDLTTLKYVKTNKNASRLLKYSAQEFTNMGPLDISPKFQPDGTPSSEKVKQYIEEALQGKKVTFEWMHRDADKKIIPCEVQLTLLPGANPPRLYASIVDISERLKMQKKLQQQFKTLAKQNKEIEKRAKELRLANKELQKTNRELDRFVYSTSHDLRAPLKSLLGLANIIMEDIDPENTVQLMQMDMMKNSIVKLDNFIEDILQYSRNTRTKVATEEIHFEDIIQGILKEHKYMNGDKIALKVKVQQDTKFVSDQDRLKVVLNNLISNALKYADLSKDKPFVAITVTCSNDQAVIQVEDNGIGINTTDQAKVFDMFYRATKVSSGSGIGLYIVKETLEKLNGTITVKSKLNKGTTFTVTLPNHLKFVN